MQISRVDTEAMVGLISVRMPSHRILGSVAMRGLLMKMAMIRVSNALQERLLRSKLILQVHDELIFEVPDSELQQASELIKATMEGVMDLGVPLRVNLEKGESWGDIH